ncbi:hypothetical protein F4861DRAFT_118709 [Xylaria intraflava]|nr:hypothetical protein F4861DRAFT_118709 [Xylaria intraflava]
MSFPNFICIQCTRRLSHLARTSPSSKHLDLRRASPRLSRAYTRLSGAQRLYSTASDRTTDGQASARDSPSKTRLTSGDIPPFEFWRTWVRPPLIKDLSPEECHEALQAYVDAAQEDTKGWERRLIAIDDAAAMQNAAGKGKSKSKRPVVSAYTLYYAAVLIITRSSGPSWNLAKHIQSTLTGLDYVPSLFMYMQTALRGRLLGKPQFEPLYQKFKRVLNRIGDGSDGKSASEGGRVEYAADACTLRALISASENTREGDNNALRWFRRAYEIDAASQPKVTSSAPDESSNQKARDDYQEDPSNDVPTLEDYFNPRWQWKASFALGVGAIHLKRGNIEQARAMFAMAAYDVDIPMGYYKLAEVLEKAGEADTGEYAKSLEKAAISGNQDAARKMASWEWNKVATTELSKWEKMKSQVLAEEWMAIASTPLHSED